ncbi:MAG TPA: WYL domain-containing protein [Marinilabiliales bacterium]|nr:MAG: WYL domain-containing protein [Bacteroidetes bacterium GWA2_40_14]OFX75211.1 MAG: WYL domain-containing protein [Bacteroidetes bacterium GWD2_40_43]OFX89808.1 MAG: WYL domain-containing protein [Bacteroidetes bacterium GWE2_40_63]OFY21999.1 MAG: WYL domain-containing protein [Bacteroidetes bacterium GWF2_40_13]OFZ26106.1 MAG: WYL domain-containing protein [Bacteroidetes bacterium RIFOXYC2_FULL_40_12]HAM97051.1 WYL domain-containing protein [Marinilabiliales bacterium]
MSKRESIYRYSLIIKKLRKHPATFIEISNFLAFESELQEYNFNVSKRTFQRDLEDIRSIYNIDIQYDFSRRVYFIDFEQQPEINKRIMEAYDIFNALNMADRLSSYIHFEKRKPQGTESLYGLLHAIQNHVQISFSYQKYWEDKLTLRIVEPYALKEFKNRWYILANDMKDQQVKSFALDRLNNLEISRKQFKFPNHFNVHEYYKNCFGIISPNNLILQEVILSFDSYQGKYIKSLPLHETQEILKDDNNELLIKLTLYITYDFIMELLSFGENLKVISPDCLIVDLKKAYQNALNRY